MIRFCILYALLGVFVRPSEALATNLRCALPKPQQLILQEPATCPPREVRKNVTTEPESGSGWRYKPHCIQGRERQYCTHTTDAFRKGGLSIIATPKAAEAASAVFASAPKTGDEVDDKLLEIKDIPGKGKGVIAKQMLKKGQRIMVDAARIITSSQLPIQLNRDEGLALMNSAVDMLPSSTRTQVLDLDKSAVGNGIDDILKTNTFACHVPDGSEGDGEGYLCLFPLVSRINHACRPNANAKFIPRTLHMEISTLRDIQPGEEISISYGRIDLKHAERQKLYRDGWHFTCTCSLCSADKYAIAGSDQRRERFAKLHEQLSSITGETYDAQQIIAWEKEVLEISDREGFETLIAEDLERLAYVYNGLGRKSEAVMWAKRTRRNLMQWWVVDGRESAELKRIEELLGELGA